MKKLRARLNKTLLRPWIYLTFTRLIYALTAGLVVNFLLPKSAFINLLMYIFLFISIFFACLAWIAYLRLDGIKLPKLMMKRVGLRKKPVRSYGDMIDYVDEQPPLVFDDLEDEEKDICILGADSVCFLLFLVLSFCV